jgi:hypothetical protein
MEWLTNNGEIYHHVCKRWSVSVERGTCEHCRNPIPAEILREARGQMEQRMRLVRNREVWRRGAETARKLADRTSPSTRSVPGCRS